MDVLPFHQLGRFKWDQLGMNYQLHDAEPPFRDTMEAAAARFRAVGLEVV